MTQAQAILHLLSDHRWHSSRELYQASGSFRYGARIDDLRKKGHVIESKAISVSMWEYRLIPKEGQVELL